MRYLTGPVISIERDVDIEVPPDNEPWRNIDYMETVGRTLAELYNNAIYYSHDQDGGESDTYKLEELPLNDFDIESEKIKKLYIDYIVKAEIEAEGVEK